MPCVLSAIAPYISIGPNIGAIVGGTIGGFVFLILVIFVIVLIVKYKCRKPHKIPVTRKDPQYDEYDDPYKLSSRNEVKEDTKYSVYDVAIVKNIYHPAEKSQQDTNINEDQAMMQPTVEPSINCVESQLNEKTSQTTNAEEIELELHDIESIQNRKNENTNMNINRLTYTVNKP